MIVTDFDIRGRSGGGTTPKRMFSPAASMKLLTILNGPEGRSPVPAAKPWSSVQTPTLATQWKLRKVRVDHGGIGDAREEDAACGFILCCAVDPESIKNKVIGGSALNRRD